MKDKNNIGSKSNSILPNQIPCENINDVSKKYSSNDSGKTNLIIVLVIALLIASGMIVFLLLNNDEKEIDSTSNNDVIIQDSDNGTEGIVDDDSDKEDITTESSGPENLYEKSVFYQFEPSYARTVEECLSDKLGNEYYNCIEYKCGYDDSYEIYVLGGEYSKFTGTLFVPSERLQGCDDCQNGNFYFKIYGDDRLLYTSPKMISTQYPVNFEVDVTGVDQLKLSWHGGAGTWYVECGLADALLYK